MKTLRSLFCLAAFACTAAIVAAPASAQTSDGKPGLKLERIVMLMRHGIRPPTKAAVTPPGIAADPWPSWDVPYGHLTEHGYAAIKLVAAYDKASLSARGLIPPQGCPAKGSVVVWSDTDQRTIRTGDAVVEGFAPDCGVANGHKPQDSNDPLFHPFEAPKPPVVDPAKARAAVLENIGSLEALRQTRKAAFDRMSTVLGCCSVKVCAKANLPEGCSLSDLPGDFAPELDDGRPKMTGIFDFTTSAAQSLMLSYVEGKPMSEVGWGRASRADLELIMSLHSMKGELVQRPFYIAQRGASPLARRMLETLEGKGNKAKVTVLVGHDTNISDLSGFLGFQWQVTSYPANTPPPGGAVGFELLRDTQGAQYVRIFYRSQTMDQMRNLETLNAAQPPYHQYLAIPGCSVPGDDTTCTLQTFTALVRGKLLPPT